MKQQAPASSPLLSQQDPATLRIRPLARRSGNLLLDLPIAGRLALGFLTAAMIAALVTGIIGALRTQSLGRQSDFYQSLLATNTSLNVGADSLQLINTEMQQIIDATISPNPSKETIITEKNAVLSLTNRYDTLINYYISHNLLDQHPDQVSLLAEGNHTIQITQQRTLVDSTLRTWHVYHNAQGQILDNLQTGNVALAQNLLRVQGEPTNADAQSALHALILFDQRIASSIRDAAAVEEQNQIIITAIGAVIAFILIALVGWFISNTLVRRLVQLRLITQAVEQGQLNARVTIIGRDEIANVGASFNAMLEAIVRLLGETRQQRDVLTNAAEHLFSDMRVVSSGDLRINASVSNDPIGMLANAFNFTVGRFRRFVLHTQGVVEQLDVISRQEMERAEKFAQMLQGISSTTTASLAADNMAHSSRSSRMLNAPQSEASQTGSDDNTQLITQLQHARGRLQQLSRDGISKHTHAMLSLLEQTLRTVERLSKALITSTNMRGPHTSVRPFAIQQEDLQALEATLQNMMLELQNMQRNITKGFLEVDAELTRIGARIQESRNKPTIAPLAPLTASSSKSSPELARQSLGFAKEITVIARQLMSLAQEMRATIVSFQFDTTNANNPLTMPEESKASHWEETSIER